MRYGLTDLKLIVAIDGHGSVSRGAAECFLSPSSASLRVKALEESLGTKLFVRQSRGVKLTQAGRVFAEHARHCLGQLQKMHADLAPFSEGVQSQITIYSNTAAISSVLVSDLGAFLRGVPGARIALEERFSHEIVTALVEGRADIGVVHNGVQHPELQFWPYREEELVVVTSESFFFEVLEARQADIAKHPFISLRSSSSIHTFVTNTAQASGHRLDVRIQVPDFSAVLDLVRHRAGISIVPRSLMDKLGAEGLRAIPIAEPWAKRHLCVCALTDVSRMSSHAQSLLRALLAHHNPEPHK